MLACGEARYFCSPSTHVDGQWCVANGDSGSDRPRDTDTAVDDTGAGDSGIADTADSAEDTAEPDDSADSGEPKPARVVINEYMASNDTKAADELGEFDDWIELYNAGGESLSLADCSLTDDSEELGLFTFPADLSLNPGDWLVVWADAAPEQGPLHAPFTLSSAGDRIFLVRDPLGSADVLDAVEFTEMATEVAWARVPDGGTDWVVTANVSPGGANQP